MKGSAQTYTVWCRVLSEPRKTGGDWPATGWHVLVDDLSEEMASARASGGQKYADNHNIGIEYVVLPAGLDPNAVAVPK